MGLPWLGLCHAQFGNREKALEYLIRTTRVMSSNTEIPELYIPERDTPNENTPLGWAHALFLVLFDAICLPHAQRTMFD